MTAVPGFSTMSLDSTGALSGWIYISFFSWWQMPLLFSISGMSTHIALERKSVLAYSRERIFRLLIPLLFFMLCLWQPLAYFWPTGFTGRSVAHYFSVFWPDSLKHLLYNEYDGSPQWAHMWFVAYLTIFSFILLPVFRFTSKRKISWFSIPDKFLKCKPVLFLFPAIAFILCFYSLEPFFPGHQNNLYNDWSYFTYNMLAFISGYYLCKSGKALILIDQYRFILLAMALIFSVVLIYLNFFSNHRMEPRHSYSFLVYAGIYGLNTWLWILALLGLFRRYLNIRNKALRYFNRASYPFYIFHLVLMVVIGHFITQLEFSPLIEFIYICVLSLIATILCYEVVKRWSISRILLGIKSYKS
jgi:hypothetical protein